MIFNLNNIKRKKIKHTLNITTNQIPLRNLLPNIIKKKKKGYVHNLFIGCFEVTKASKFNKMDNFKGNKPPQHEFSHNKSA